MKMLLQFADSTLPVGGYAHSFGLEGMCQSGAITNQGELRPFLLRDVTHSLLTVDLPLMKGAFLFTNGLGVRKKRRFLFAISRLR